MLKGTAIFPLYWPFHIFHLFHKSTENVYKGVNLGPFISSFEDSFCILFKEMEKLNKIIQEFPTSRLRNKYKKVYGENRQDKYCYLQFQRRIF